MIKAGERGKVVGFIDKFSAFTIWMVPMSILDTYERTLKSAPSKCSARLNKEIRGIFKRVGVSC